MLKNLENLLRDPIAVLCGTRALFIDLIYLGLCVPYGLVLESFNNF